MRIITVSRQFSSGGRELAKRLADILGFDYYDREIISEIAKNTSLDENFVESSLFGACKAVPLHFARSFTIAFANMGNTQLLVEEKRVIDQIARRGKDFIIVGRNADLLLKEHKPLNIFVCADLESKIQRCIDKALIGENPTRKEIEKHTKEIDKRRAASRAILSESKWGDPCNYHLTINTTGRQIKELTPVVCALVKEYFGE